ncbi:mechanosensitive ion channel [Pseudoalteromonas sp. McH1-7]|uniref:mechanosensitive ion channel family protein n=1 Tax=Pseudoalteromonas TaxID=53246 RepID=UPI000F6479F9|nr:MULTISPECIES: mechanosensitive ion channel domain-containing protein [Pseudoalteromonas]NUZ11087.1 mechanosensitive ion channel [Pseudoalteromonas sp. McH1-7]MDW7547921.1 mechanosensitive ion channel [Pseudoalteromonas peptidolytica]RRS07472.1 mechanosensitive ion channel family protein [Pseudoalteromonas sp. J010]RXF03203.1 mechanosensitive ion channel family protein [Pseudoalteromonas sp. PS5]USD27479.1 mechanosensitive ion channel [Pseudoalteromonas sp. SCSIO 43201]
MINQEIEQIERYYNIIREYLVTYSFQLLAAIAIFLLGLWLSKKLSKATEKLMLKHSIDPALTNFVGNVIKVLIIAMFVVISLGKIGISITPFVAAIGAASLGAGLALQGMLANYGAGLAIIATRPFVIGDTISIKGVSGQVKMIELGHTTLINEDNVEITIPNKHIVGEILHNSFENSLVKGEIGIAYHADYEQALLLINNALANNSKVSQSPKPQVGIETFADSAVVLSYRYWVPTTALIETKLEINKAVFAAINNANIEIPFPQRVIKLIQ